ncbi:cytochrome P450 4C1-like isoform X3 [Pectinophora gossypiella]|nr:cytochrome P450 4C1-like isoform X3 [Pectinophora gossypiella]
MDPVKLFYYFRSLANQYKHLFKLKLGPKMVLIVHNPEDVETIISGVSNSSKGFLYRFIKPWLQEGLLLSDGPKWQHRRKILTPTFHFNILRHFCSVLEENSRKLVEQLESEVGMPKTNVSSYIIDFTLNSICETAMGTKLDPETSDVGKRYKDSVHKLGTLLVHRSQRVWTYPDWVFSLTSAGRKQKEVLDLLGSFRDNVINKRRENNNNNSQTFILDDKDDDITPGKKKLAMLDLLLQAEKEGIIDAKGIGEEVDTFMFEGHDTTGTALQFAFMLLANNPESQEKVAAECYEIFGDSDREATMNDLGKMKYLECCIKEAIRLYPPVAFIMRKIDKNLKLKQYEVPAGIDCAILIYDLQRRNDQFVEPQQFRPERFLVEPTWHPYAYLPFSAGPRNCIGQKFAMMEMKHSLSAVIRRYRLRPVTRPADVVFVTDFILRPRDPIYVQFQHRFT